LHYMCLLHASVKTWDSISCRILKIVSADFAVRRFYTGELVYTTYL